VEICVTVCVVVGGIERGKIYTSDREDSVS
jgi:hypothetical protein